MNKSKSTGKIYKNARKKLGITMRQAYERCGVDNASISKLERDLIESPNHKYTKFLISQGINPYYLIGESEEIEGQKIDGVTRAEYETLQQNFDDLQKNYQKLEDQYNLLERVLQLLQIEVDQEGNVRQKK